MNTKNITLIIIVSLVTGFVYNHLSPSGLPLIRKEIEIEFVSDSTFSQYENDSGDENLVIKGLTIEQTYDLYTKNMAAFIDARDQWEYGESHIEGAINIPEFSFEPDDPIVMELDKGQLYILYCDGDDCDISKRLAMELMKLGFTKVYVFLGGIYEWVEAGYPVAGEGQ